MSGYSTPYAHAHYLGEWADDAAALAEVQARKWDSTADGRGTFRNGMLYYNTTAHAFVGYAGGSTTNIATTGSFGLDEAYNIGRSITVDAGAVELTAANASNCAALSISQLDITNNPAAAVISNSGTGPSLSFAGLTRSIESDAGLEIQADGKLSVGTGAGSSVTFGALTREVNLRGDVLLLTASGASGNMTISLDADSAVSRVMAFEADNADARASAGFTFSDSYQKDSAGAGGYSSPMPYAAGSSDWTNFKDLYGDGTSLLSAVNTAGDHGTHAGLDHDDHTQYALLAGRAGGQTIVGGTLASQELVLQSTDHATRGDVRIESLFYFKSTAVLEIVNGTEPGAHVDNAIQIFSVDSSASAATLGLYLEETVGLAATTPDARVKIKVNGTEYYWPLQTIPS